MRLLKQYRRTTAYSLAFLVLIFSSLIFVPTVGILFNAS
jgi:hypothetical protein